MPFGAPDPTSNYNEYRQCAAEVAEQAPAEWRFKHDPRYQRILEHVSSHQASMFAACAASEFASRWEAIRAIAIRTAFVNDSFGSPHVAPCDELGIICSPTNLRYLWHALLVLRRLEQMKWLGHILEVGGGYGGLALYVHALAGLFPTVQIQSYTLIDLPEITALQAAFVKELALPVRTVCGLYEADLGRAILDTDGERFFISAYAFSEFDQRTRDWYESKVLRHCQHGFIVWNFMHGLGGFEVPLGGPIYGFVDATIEVEPEHPVVDPGQDNQFVWW